MRKTVTSLVLLSLILSACASLLSPGPQEQMTLTLPAPAPTVVETATQPDTVSLPDPDSLPPSGLLGIHLSEHGDEQQLTFFANSGAVWSRFDRFHWDLIEAVPQTPPVYDWSSVDEAGLMNAAGHGIKLIGMVLFTPPYVQKYPGSICGPVAEEHLNRFGEFLHALVTRYSQAPYLVKYWEIGNEPDVDYAFANRSGFGCWGDPNDIYYGGGYYAQMLKVVYPKIKAADPEAQVLVGGLLLDCDPRNPPETSAGSGVLKDCTPARFLDGILENDGAAYFDGISFHAYDYYSFKEGKYSNGNWHSRSTVNGVVSIPKAGYLQERLIAYGITDKYLLNTESGLICGSSGKEEGCLSEAFARTKAAYIVHTNMAAFSLGLRVNIWYSLMGWRGSELVTDTYQSLPAYEAFRVNNQIMKEAIFIREVFDYPSLFIYEFITPRGGLWVMWSRSGEAETVQLPFQPLAVYDLYGTSLSVSQVMSVNYAPVYIEY
jgi:hypothetical protein